MPTPQNLLEQLVMQMREPQDPQGPKREFGASVEDEVLATLLTQSLQPGERIPPADVFRPQLANDLGLTEEDLTLNLMGAQNMIQTGIAPAGSLLGTVAQDRGLDTNSMRDIVRGNAALSNSDVQDSEAVAQDREATAGAASRVPEPGSEDILAGLLAEARGVTEQANPDMEAAFQNKLARFMRDPNSTPAQRKAAYQLRHPDMTVEVQEDGVMSFSDKGPGLQIKDDKTRRAVDNVRARLETLSPDQPIVVGEGSEIAALAASTKQRIADNVTTTRTNLFGPPSSKSVANIQSQLESIVNISDPNERAIALQRMGPSIAAYGNQRRNELRSEVFQSMGIAELERSLAMQEARDRSDPRWDEFRRDSPKTASTRAQLRQARSDALTMVDNRVKSDPMLNTLQSQTAMTEAIVSQQNKTDASVQLSDMADKLAPQGQERIKTAIKAMHPDLDVSNLSSPDVAKIMQVDEGFYSAVASLDSPSKTIATMVIDPNNAKKWRSYLKQAEIGAGADEATAEVLAKTYTNIANDSQRVLAGGMTEQELAKQGGEVRALAEQWMKDKSTMSPTEAERRRSTYYLPRMIEAKLGYLQTQEMQRADLTYTNLQPTSGNEAVDEMLKEAKDQGYTLGDLMSPEKIGKLQASQEVSVQADATGRTFPNRAKVGLFADKDARLALAKYISDARKSRMLQTAFMQPTDTTLDVERKLQVAAVTSIMPRESN